MEKNERNLFDSLVMLEAEIEVEVEVFVVKDSHSGRC